jgi:hypothetical protein
MDLTKEKSVSEESNTDALSVFKTKSLTMKKVKECICLPHPTSSNMQLWIYQINSEVLEITEVSIKMRRNCVRQMVVVG